MRKMYGRTVERELGDEKTNVIGKMPSRELDKTRDLSVAEKEYES